MAQPGRWHASAMQHAVESLPSTRPGMLLDPVPAPEREPGSEPGQPQLRAQPVLRCGRSCRAVWLAKDRRHAMDIAIDHVSVVATMHDVVPRLYYTNEDTLCKWKGLEGKKGKANLRLPPK